MSATPTEARLAALAERTFLKLWSYPNPYRARGKEFADLLVVFGRDILVFSDKASDYQGGDPGTAWRRWYQRTVTESLKQLKGAVRQLTSPGAKVFVDPRAGHALPFSLPPVEERRLYLIGTVCPARVPEEWPAEFGGVVFDSTIAGDEKPFAVSALKVMGQIVHLFEGKTLELLLKELDTVADFVEYLRRRETAITQRRALRFEESDLLALALEARGPESWAPIRLPEPNQDGITTVPTGLWKAYSGGTVAERRRVDNRLSYNIDRLIEHFHGEYVANRYLQPAVPTYESHEQALRILASESRFGRRLIAGALNEIMTELDQETFWAATVASRDVPGTRYVWLTYPRAKSLRLEEMEAYVLHHLKEHVFVARAIFPAHRVVGIALPNPEARTQSYFMTILDGTKWDEEAQAGAEKLIAEGGIFADLQEFQQLHLH
jgi:hypothetical protein